MLNKDILHLNGQNSHFDSLNLNKHDEIGLNIVGQLLRYEYCFVAGFRKIPPRKVRKTTLAPSALAGRNSTLEKGAGARSDAVSGLIGLGAGMMLDRDRYTNHNLLHNLKKKLKLLTLF